MLEIKEVSDTEGYEDIVKSAAGGEFHITESLENGRKTGYIAYIYGEDKTVVCGLDDGNDLLLCDGLVRSVMLKSVLKGINRLDFEIADESIFRKLEKLRFLENGSRICSGIEKFMDGCGNCKNKS